MRNVTAWVLRLAFALALSLSLLACAPAASGPYLESRISQHFENILPAPPADDSDEHRAELRLVLSAQRAAAAQTIERVRLEYLFTPEAFQNAIGPTFDEKHYPETFALLLRVIKEADTWNDSQKHRFKRARPFKDDPEIKGLDVRNADNLSYPSGHSFRGTLFGLILAEIFPEKAEAIIRRSQEIGWDRIVAGMHHPSDINAGRFMASLVFQELLHSPRFQTEIANAKDEAFQNCYRKSASRVPDTLQ